MSARNPLAHPPVKIEPLGKIHDRAAFYCGSEELDTYLKESASREARKQISTSFVLVEDGDNSVIGYYCLSATRILLGDLPEKTAKKLPGYPDVPATRLGRLAVDMHHLREGVWRSLAGGCSPAIVPGGYGYCFLRRCCRFER